MMDQSVCTPRLGEDAVAVLGAGGMLGRDLCSVLNAAGWQVHTFDRPHFDLCNETHVNEVAARFPVVINCAAYTNVEKAESDRAAAFAVNAVAVGLLGRAVEMYGGRVLHVSTDFVFDGSKLGAYNEDDEPNPLSVYGSSKLEGEIRLRDSGCDCCILRVQWTYGRGGANFIDKIRVRAVADGDVKVVDDQMGAPTWTRDVACVMSELATRAVSGLYHFAAAGCASRCDVARFIVARCAPGAVVYPCASSDFPSVAKRPANSVFDCGRIDRLLSLTRRRWEIALADYLEKDGVSAV